MENNADSAFLQYIRAENAYCDYWSGRNAALQQILQKEIQGTESAGPASEERLSTLPDLIRKQYVLMISRNSLAPSVRIIDIKTRKREERENRINFTDPDGSLVYAGYDSLKEKILLRYSSILTPPTLYAYDPASRKLMIRWQRRIPGYNKDDYAAKLLWVSGRDGTKIPLTILYRQDLDNHDGTNPLLLAVAGSDSLADPVKFNPAYLPLLNRGFYIATAFVRGCGEPGRKWKEEGRGSKKDAGWNDYLDCAWFLVKDRYTAKGMITALGEGDGALVALVALSYQPELFKAAILENPGKGALSYPPDRYLRPKQYPPLFFYSDDEGMEKPASITPRMAAGLRKIKQGDQLLLVRTETGQSTASIPENETQYGKRAEIWAFMLGQYGIEK
jgi:oligopeptidase B